MASHELATIGINVTKNEIQIQKFLDPDEFKGNPEIFNGLRPHKCVDDFLTKAYFREYLKINW